MRIYRKICINGFVVKHKSFETRTLRDPLKYETQLQHHRKRFSNWFFKIELILNIGF